MTPAAAAVHPAVDWVLDQLIPVTDSVHTDYGAPVRLVDRDNSIVYKRTAVGDAVVGESSVGRTRVRRTTERKPKRANYIGASFADAGGDLVGTAPLRDGDVVVSVRIEGLHASEHGHIDPTGERGVPFDVLVERVRDAFDAETTYPGVDDSRRTYRYLTVDDSPQSVDWGDSYQHSLDVTFITYESLS